MMIPDADTLVAAAYAATGLALAGLIVIVFLRLRYWARADKREQERL